MVSLEMKSLGRVLDLRLDPRWNEFMTSTKDPYLMGRSRLDLVKMSPEAYDGMFQHFCKINKIDIKSYDAVIGPEYNLGGNQLCVLHKDGQPSPLQARLRAILRPATPVTRWTVAKANSVAAKPGELTVKAVVAPKLPRLTFRSRLKAVGGTVVGIGANILFALVMAYIDRKITQAIDQEIIDKEMKKLEPVIQQKVDQQKRAILDLLAADKPAYVNVTVRIIYYLSMNLDIEGGGGGWDRSVPGVELDSVIVGSQKVEGAGTQSTESVPYQRKEINPITFSVEATASKDEIETYRAVMQELQWYTDVLKSPAIDSSDREHLNNEKKVLEDFLRTMAA
jgi:hypothetical protein